MSVIEIERRAGARQRVLKGGRLAFDGGGGIDCMVRSLSPSGARIDVVSPIGLPESWPVLVDAAVLERGVVVIGSGLRRSKLALPSRLLAELPTAEVVGGLAR